MKNNKFKVGDLVRYKKGAVGIVTGVYPLNWEYLWVSFFSGKEPTVHQDCLEIVCK